MPIPYSFSTLTGYELLIITFMFCNLVDDRVIGYYFFAIGARNLVGHLFPSFGIFPD